MVALATRLPAYCPVGDREAVERTVMDKRWQMVLDGLGAAQPPFRQGTRYTLRLRLIAHTLDKTLLDRTGALAEQPGGFGARHLRAALDSTPLCGAGRVEDTLTLLGHALRKAVGLVAQALGPSAEAVVADAGLTLVGPSSLQAALDRHWGQPSARSRALGLLLEEVARWPYWLPQQQTLALQQPPLKAVMETITPIMTQDTEPAPEGGAGGRRLKQHGAPDRRVSLEDQAMRHGRTSSATTVNGFQEPCAVDVASTVLRAVVVRPANEPEHEVVELLAEEREKAPGLLQLAIAVGSMASPRMAPWAAQGVDMIARPWPPSGPLCTKPDCTWDCREMQGTCPGGQAVPIVPGKPAQFPAAACDTCPLRAQCPTTTGGQGRSLSIRADALFQQKRRATLKTQRGRASLRKRTAVEHAISHQWAHPGRRARYTGWAKTSLLAVVMRRSAISR
jgi:transposase